MSLFSTKTAKLPSADLKTLNLDPSRSSTNEQARPVPYFAGRARIALTWLCDVWGVRAKPIRQKVGKKKQTVGYNYFASFAGLIGAGPIDVLQAILFDGEIIWEGPLARSGDSTEIMIETRGSLTIYWGTETQTPDPHLATSGQSHPAYRAQAYIVFNSLALGQNRTQVPNVEVIADRHPLPSWLTANPSIAGDANLIAVIGELLQNPRFGLALPDDWLNVAGLAAISTQLASEELGISPLITRATTARQLLAELLEYADAFLSMDQSGQLNVNLVRPLEDLGTLPVITSQDLTDTPAIQPDSWLNTFNETFVAYTNRERDLQEDAVSYVDPGNFAITARHNPQTLQRPYCTRAEMAQRIAAAAGLVASIPRIKGSLALRWSSAHTLAVGDGFKLTYPPLQIAELVCRITAKSTPSPSKPEIKIEFEADRGYLNAQIFEPDIDPPPTTPEFDPEANFAETILEAPFGLPTPSPIEELIVLAARASGLETGLDIHRQLPSETYQIEAQTEHFAITGTLDEAYPADTSLIDDAIGILVTLDGADSGELETPAFIDALTNDFLLYLGDEILCPYAGELISGSTWRIYTIRARFDTIRQTHPADSRAWFQERNLGAYVPSAATQATQTWKLQPFSINREVDLALVDPIIVTTTHRALRPYRPLNLEGNGEQNSAAYATAGNLLLTWSPTMEDRPPIFSLWGGGLTANLPGTRLEIRDASTDNLLDSIELDPGLEAYTLTNAEIVAALGSELAFNIRAYQRRDSFLSTHYATLQVSAP